MQPDPALPAAHHALLLSPARRWAILIAVGICLFLGSVDGSIVNVALPTLMKEFRADFPTIQWVVLSYLLGLTVLMVGAGRLADLVGKKRIFVTGIVLFVIASMLCGLAPTVQWLIGFRVLQSVGAAMIISLGTAILTETWPSNERGKAIGFAAGFISLGIVVGPALGGLILQWLSWHWVFFVNLPFGIAALVLVLLYVPSLLPTGKAERFDFLGAAVLGLTLLSATLALTFAETWGFSSPLVLALIETRVAYPMVDLSLFRDAQFSLNLFTSLITFIAIAGIVFLLPFYLELVMGLGLRDVGLMMAVVPIVMAFLQPYSGTLSDRWGTRPVSVLGLAVLIGGYLAMAGLAVDSSAVGFNLRMLPVAIGMALFQSPNNSAMMGAVPRHRLGVASGILSMVRTLGQVIGIAALGAFFNGRIALHNGGPINLRDAGPAVITAALHDQFTLVALLVAVALTTALLTWRWERRRGALA
jgi:EmrB/QacA subfamily drug resistance transporter